MLGFITKIDDRLMDVFERVSRRIQIITGYNCIKQSLIVSLSSPIGLSLFLSFPETTAEGFLGKIMLSLFLPLLSFAYFYFECQGAEKKVEKLSELQARSPLYQEFMWGRAISLCMLIFWFLFFVLPLDAKIGIAAKTLIIVMFVGSVCFTHLISCTPLPPGKSKARKLIESLAGSLKKLVTENPV